MRVKYKPWAVQYLVDHPEVAKEKFDPNDDFFKAPKIALEIGSGKGDFILTLAKRNPDTHYVSVEVIRSVAGVLAKKIVDKINKNNVNDVNKALKQYQKRKDIESYNLYKNKVNNTINGFNNTDKEMRYDFYRDKYWITKRGDKNHLFGKYK